MSLDQCPACGAPGTETEPLVNIKDLRNGVSYSRQYYRCTNPSCTTRTINTKGCVKPMKLRTEFCADSYREAID